MKKAIVAVPFLKGTGGTETVIKNFAQALDVKDTKADISWKLISFGGSNNSEWMNGWNKKVYNFSNLRYVQLVAYAGLMPVLIARILKREKPDFFISTNPIIWSLAYKLRKSISPKTKIIAWYHYSFKMKKVKLKYLKMTDKFWAISSGIKDELTSMGVSRSKTDVIYNPINVNNVKIINRSRKQNHFIYIGRIDYDGQKNVSELIKALNKVNGQWKCDFYGTIDKSTKEKLQELALNKVNSYISFCGFYKNVWSNIKEADVLILTSKFEGLPMVLMEAISRGIPIITSNCPTGTKDIVNKDNGWLYQMGEIDQLASLLNSVILNKVQLPTTNDVKQSAHLFSYGNYKIRVLKSLNEPIF